MGAFPNQNNHISVFQAHRKLPYAFDGIGVDLGLVAFQLCSTFQFANGILIVIQNHDIHGRNCALPVACADDTRQGNALLINSMQLNSSEHRLGVAPLAVFRRLLCRNSSGTRDLASRQAIEFGADISHATGYDHATDASACLPCFDHANYAQWFAYSDR
jgi:hypothetical protein